MDGSQVLVVWLAAGLTVFALMLQVAVLLLRCVGPSRTALSV